MDGERDRRRDSPSDQVRRRAGRSAKGETRSRRSVRWRRIVVRRIYSLHDRCNQLESVPRGNGRGHQMKSGLMQRNVVQPDNVFIVVRKLSMVVVVRIDRMRLKMTVGSRPRMVCVGLVHVLRRNDRRKGDVRHQKQAGSDPAERGRHATMIIVADESSVKRAGSPAFHVIFNHGVTITAGGCDRAGRQASRIPRSLWPTCTAASRPEGRQWVRRLVQTVLRYDSVRRRRADRDLPSARTIRKR